MARNRYGMVSACKHCKLDIQFFGNRQWFDRGNNRKCPGLYSEAMGKKTNPRTVHKPVLGDGAC